MIIYGDSLSGNCYKIKLLCSLLNIEHQWIEVNIMAGETRTSEFLAINPNAKIPLLITEQKQALAESNAILYYLAQDSHLFPQSVLQQSLCLQWMFFEQYSHEPYIAVARFINKYLGSPADRLQELESKKEGGNRALAVMEIQLQKTPYLLGDEMSIADISLFAYTHVAYEGGFDLNEFPAILAWISRIEHQKNFIHIG
ncbi:glutathione S-transferase family protein [uncultured Psychromonas sp.]|uniref:glutathione S-transferase family protein n=1 Tax=uncultured Psychromonas sp. TaxID=173974 RepID=UPI00260B44D5|nr:glutathione S-transferase family protein [uncultured Psychromonas sp.]